MTCRVFYSSVEKSSWRHGLQLELINGTLSWIVPHLVNINALANLRDIFIKSDWALTVTEADTSDTLRAVLASIVAILYPRTHILKLGRPAGLKE
jgi:hypothetical protein